MLSGWRLPEILNRLIKYLFVYVSELLHVSDAAVVLPEKDTAAIALYTREPLSHNGMCEHIKFDKYSLYCLGCVWPYNMFFDTGRLLLPWQPTCSKSRTSLSFLCSNRTNWSLRKMWMVLPLKNSPCGCCGWGPGMTGSRFQSKWFIDSEARVDSTQQTCLSITICKPALNQKIHEHAPKFQSKSNDTQSKVPIWIKWFVIHDPKI